jgi:hypothetical protein
MNNIKKAIIKANNAIASANANPKIAALNKSSLIVGFLAIPLINAANINPIPTPAPAKPNVENPAPNFCALCNNIYFTNVKKTIYIKNNIKILFC